MAKLSAILQLEKLRATPEEQRIIHLWADGSFYRAYEWSAWLAVRYIKQFKVTRRTIKSVGSDMLFIGFPQSSMEKFRPGKAVLQENTEEKRLLLILPEDVVKADEGSTLEQDFQNWRTTIPLTEGKTPTDETTPRTAHLGGGSVSVTGIMRQVLEFSVEAHSPIDCMLFLAELKKQVSSLL